MIVAGGASVVDPSPMDSFVALVDGVRQAVPVRVESKLTLEVRVDDAIESIRPDASVYVFDAHDQAMLRSNGWTWYVLDGQIVIEHADDAAAYVRQVGVEPPLQLLRNHFVSIPDPYLSLMLGGDDPAGIAADLHDGDTPFTPTDVVEDGRRLILKGANATMSFTIDESGRPKTATVDVTIEEEGLKSVRQRWNWSWSYSPMEPEDAEAAVQFERGRRHRVDSVRMLRTTPSSPDASDRGGRDQ